jgi:hypothetical protein
MDRAFKAGDRVRDLNKIKNQGTGTVVRAEGNGETFFSPPVVYFVRWDNPPMGNQEEGSISPEELELIEPK